MQGPRRWSQQGRVRAEAAGTPTPPRPSTAITRPPRRATALQRRSHPRRPDRRPSRRARRRAPRARRRRRSRAPAPWRMRRAVPHLHYVILSHFAALGAGIIIGAGLVSFKPESCSGVGAGGSPTAVVNPHRHTVSPPSKIEAELLPQRSAHNGGYAGAGAGESPVVNRP